MSVFARGSKYRIKERHDGRFYIERKGWFIWHKLGYMERGFFLDTEWQLKTYESVVEAEKAIKEFCRQNTYPRIVKNVKCGE